MTVRSWRGLLLAACLPLAAGCAADLKTAHELGLGPFEPLIGAETQLRPQPIKGGRLDAASADGGGKQAAHLTIVPTGTVESVVVAVGAIGLPDSHAVAGVALAIYPLEAEAAFGYEFRGELPPGEPLLFALAPEPDPDGAVRLLAKLPRDQVPADTRRIAIPVVVRFANGGIHVNYLHSVVPEPAFVASDDPVQDPPGEGQ